MTVSVLAAAAIHTCAAWLKAFRIHGIVPRRVIGILTYPDPRCRQSMRRDRLPAGSLLYSATVLHHGGRASGIQTEIRSTSGGEGANLPVRKCIVHGSSTPSCKKLFAADMNAGHGIAPVIRPRRGLPRHRAGVAAPAPAHRRGRYASRERSGIAREAPTGQAPAPG